MTEIPDHLIKSAEEAHAKPEGVLEQRPAEPGLGDEIKATLAGPLDKSAEAPEASLAAVDVAPPSPSSTPIVGESPDQWRARTAQEQAASNNPDSDPFTRTDTPEGPVAPTGERAPVAHTEPATPESSHGDIEKGQELVERSTGRHFRVERVLQKKGGKRIAELAHGEGEAREKVYKRVDRLTEMLAVDGAPWGRVQAEPDSEQASGVVETSAHSSAGASPSEPQPAGRMPERPVVSASEMPVAPAGGIAPGEVFVPAESVDAAVRSPDHEGAVEGSDEAFESAVDRIERSDTATFAGRTYARGEIISYTSSSGATADYVVLCNTYGDPPGLALQAVNNEALVFRVAGDVDPVRVSPPDDNPPPPGPPDDGPPPPPPPGPPGPPDDGPPPPPPPGPPGPPDDGPPPPPPPGPPGPPDDGPPPPPPPGEDEPAPEPMPDIPASAAGLEDAIQRLAKAKDRRESIFSRFHRDRDGRDDQAELEAATENLKRVFAEHVSAVAQAVKSRNDVARTDMTRVQADYHARLAAGEDAASLEMVALAREYRDAKAGIGKLETDNTLLIVQEMAAARYRVDRAQLDLKKSKWPGKFRELWTKHPAMRAGIGAALTLGAVATGAFAPPLALGFVGAKRLFGTAGTYMGVEGAGRAIGNRRSSKADVEAAKQSLGDLESGSGTGEATIARSAAERASLRRPDGGEIPEEARSYIEQFVQENYQDIFVGADSLRARLHGAEVDPSAVVGRLLDRRLEQLKSDVTWTRRSKYLAATGAFLVNSVAIYHWADSFKNPFGGAGGGGEASTKLNEAFLKGAMDQQKARGPINWEALRSGTGAQQRADAMFDNSAAKDWVKAVKALPEANQEKAAELIGFQNSAGTLTPASLNQIIVSNS